MALSKKSYLAACLETTPGTLAAAPQLYIPCKSNIKGKKKRVYPPEERGTRDGNNVVQDTNQFGDVDVKGAWYNDTFPMFLLAFMGSDTPTQPDATHAATVYKHTFGLTDTPPSLSLWKSYDAQVYQCVYSVVSKIGLKLAADCKLIEADVTLKSNRPAKYLGTALTPTFSTLLPFQGYKPTITLAGSPSTDIEELDVTLEQKVALWYPINGTPDYTKVYFGERTAKIDFTARFDNTTIYDYFENNTDVTFVLDARGQLIVNSGASGTPPNTDYFEELNLNFPILGMDEIDHELGKDFVTIKAKGTARPGAAANSLFTAYAQNTITAYTPA